MTLPAITTSVPIVIRLRTLHDYAIVYWYQTSVMNDCPLGVIHRRLMGSSDGSGLREGGSLSGPVTCGFSKFVFVRQKLESVSSTAMKRWRNDSKEILS